MAISSGAGVWKRLVRGSGADPLLFEKGYLGNSVGRRKKTCGVAGNEAD